MPQAGSKEYSTFVRGLITEASALTFPENASIDEDNFVLNRNGSRQRRLGMDYENTYALVDTSLDSTFMMDATLKSFRWDNVDSNPNISIGIVQIYNTLWFVDLFASTLSTNLLNGGASLTITGLGNDPISFTQVNGVAIGTNKNIDPIYLEYDPDTDTISQVTIDITVRDLWGVDDGLEVSTRPASLSTAHKYNLFNQGWNEFYINETKTGSGNQGTYPSNADIAYLGKSSTGAFTPLTLLRQLVGNTPAPKGAAVISAWDRSVDRTARTGVAVIADAELGRPSTAVSYAQRIFYSGINSNVSGGDSRSPNYSGFIFFSKIVTGTSDLGKCYQEADPASEYISDIIDSDGGYIAIPEASNILKLETTENSIVVITENGVWEIYGDTGGFSATSFQISKVTNIGATNADSIVNAEGTIYYWSKGGIYTLTIDRVSGRLVATNITESTIQTYFNDINAVAKANAVGNYDAAAKRVSWLYNNDSTYDGVTERNKYNKELIFDTVLGSFYPSSISSTTTDSPYVAGYIPTPNFLSTQHSQNVVVNGVQVQANGVDVVVTDTFRTRGSSATKYLAIKPSTTGNYKFTFSRYVDDAFVDWASDDGTGADFTSYLITGYELFGESMRYKQVPYITFHFNRTETGFETSGTDLIAKNPSSCLVQARWEFADHANSGKYGTQFQAYRLKRNYIPSGASDNFDYGHSVITTKSKLRGRGRSLSLYITSEAGKDMYLLGWGLNATGGTVV